ncbi:MFS transporter [Streptantibioticus silvisoli]
MPGAGAPGRRGRPARRRTHGPVCRGTCPLCGGRRPYGPVRCPAAVRRGPGRRAPHRRPSPPCPPVTAPAVAATSTEPPRISRRTTMSHPVLPRRPEARWILVGAALSALGRGLTLPFLFIYLTEVRGLSGTLAGLAIGLYGVGSLVLSPVGGSLIDRIGVRRVLLPCLAIEGVGTAGLAFVGSLWTVLLVMTVIAIGSSAIWAGQSVLLASLTAPGERQRVFGLQFTLLNLGMGLGGLMSGAVIDVHRPVTFQAIYLLDGLSFFAPLVILLMLRGVGRTTPGPSAASAAPRAGRSPVGYLAVLRDRPFRRLILFGLVLATCGYAQIQVGFTAYAVQFTHVTPRIVAWALAGNTVVIVVSQLLMVRLLEHRSRSAVLAAVGGLFAVAWLALGAGGHAGGGVLPVLGVVTCAAVFGFGETLLSPVMPAVTNALASDALRGRYNSVSSMVFGMSGVIGPVTAGPLLELDRGTVWVVLVVAGSLVASLLALSLRPLLTAAEDGRAVQQAPRPELARR